MRIVVTGAGGQLGRALVDALPARDVFPLSHRDLDITDTTLLRALALRQPDAVVNCAAWNDVDGAEADPARAREINGRGPTNLALACRTIGAWLLQVSTDAVFEGISLCPYPEDAGTLPLNAYGRSKLTGEYGVRGALSSHAIIRTCGLYGRGGSRPNFVDRILAKARAGEPLRVVCDQVCTPTYAKDLAEAIAALLPKLLDGSAAPGVYHATNAGQCSWYDFARWALALAGLGVEPEPITTEEWNAPAPRPRYTVLANTKLPPLRHWREALADYLSADGAATRTAADR